MSCPKRIFCDVVSVQVLPNGSIVFILSLAVYFKQMQVFLKTKRHFAIVLRRFQ